MFFCTICPPTINCVLLRLEGRHRRAKLVCTECQSVFGPTEMRAIRKTYSDIILKAAGKHRKEALDEKD